MKIIYLVLVSLLFTPLPTLGQQKGSVDWHGIREAFAAYAQYPSGANATKVMSLLPESGRVKYTGDKKENEALEFVYQNLDMLERQVISRDPNAVTLAFRLMTIADGGFAEDLDSVLGQLIRIDPVLFLRQLKAARSRVTMLGGLVGNYGAVYVDKIEAQQLETDRRIRALEGVSDPTLTKLRNKSIEELTRKKLRLAVIPKT